MVFGKTEIKSSPAPSVRILELARHKNSKTIWITSPCEKLTWGNQESIWPLSYSALNAVPTERIQLLAKHKPDLSANHQNQLRKTEGTNERRKTPRPSSRAARYEHLTRLSTPKKRDRSPQETSCPVWHFDPRAQLREVSPHLEQLASPKRLHPDFKSNRESVQWFVSSAAKSAKLTPWLEHLSLPKLRETNLFYDYGPPDLPIWPVSRGARNATASPRLRNLSTPKALVKDYIAPRELHWP